MVERGIRRNAIVSIPYNQRRNALTGNEERIQLPIFAWFSRKVEKLTSKFLTGVNTICSRINGKSGKLIWMFTCFLVFILQSIWVTVTYLEYPLTSEVRVRVDSEIYPPALSLCADINIVRKLHRNIKYRYSNCYSNTGICTTMIYDFSY